MMFSSLLYFKKNLFDESKKRKEKQEMLHENKKKIKNWKGIKRIKKR